MRHTPLTAIVPAKVMLAGEYAVLWGGPCIAATLDQCLSLSVQQGPENSGVLVSSDIWPEVLKLASLTAAQCASEPLLQTLAAYKDEQALGDLAISVRSEIDVKSGFGSSTAVRLAALLALDAYFQEHLGFDSLRAEDRARQVWRLQEKLQQFASGYDVLTQLRGGLVEWHPDFNAWPGPVRQLPHESFSSWVQIWIGGRGAPTGIVGEKVLSWLSRTGQSSDLMEKSQTLVSAFRQLFLENKPGLLENVIRANRDHRQILAAAPSYPQKLLTALQNLPGFDLSWTFKTTGAGGEDAVLLIGEQSSRYLTAARQVLKDAGRHPLELGLTTQGASWKRGSEQL